MKVRIVILSILIGVAFSLPGAQLQSYAKDRPASVTRKDQTVYVTTTGAKYHRSGCRCLRRSSIPMKLNEARKSYSPCSVCQPPK